MKGGVTMYDYYGAYPVTGVMPGCAYGYGPTAVSPVHGAGRGFALIVVLFILLIIIGASYGKKPC